MTLSDLEGKAYVFFFFFLFVFSKHNVYLTYGDAQNSNYNWRKEGRKEGKDDESVKEEEKEGGRKIFIAF